ncbi:phosphoglucosamine mutase [Chlorobium phaeovibrioides]|uniref:Phosphoglucosamine mutase n=1 Tax=Chlorobium phaeovibrioides TaxID=1094 RepID=A0A3S0L1H0_CHLPH|nr:phosphoglucosamine mutase [Chlorobium phaeovibrioides]RTY39061.1 phosphoglucosamine mutase [Chlorobium phaeovibrioides]
MSLMISVSGIRGIVGESLTPTNLTAFATAFASWAETRKKEREPGAISQKPHIIIGRDTRPTGEAITGLVQSALVLSGCNVTDIGIATTPTVELAVTEEKADGGLIITASHNPVQWNALKMLNHRGEFLDKEDVDELTRIASAPNPKSARWDNIGTATKTSRHDALHIEKILALPFIHTEEIKKAKFRVLVDCVEGAGYAIVPDLCRELGIAEVIPFACGGTGIFPRTPEPIEENLQDTIAALKKSGADFALVVDPDVDRLALISEDGSLFGEEYTLVACADYYLKVRPGTVANNLSSSRALKDIASRYGQECFSAEVGEANVTRLMKKHHAVIGGEGNGGVILPELHYGRDALAAIAMAVQAFAYWQKSHPEEPLSRFRLEFPNYEMSKQKIDLTPEGKERLPEIFEAIARSYPAAQSDTRDGLKLDFPESWVHLRPSNTEPIVRIYSEAQTREKAETLADDIRQAIEQHATGA